MDKTDKLLEWAGEAGVDFKPSPRDLYASLWLGELEHIVDLATREKDREITTLRALLNSFRDDVVFRVGSSSPYREVVQAFQDRIAAAMVDKGEG